MPKHLSVPESRGFFPVSAVFRVGVHLRDQSQVYVGAEVLADLSFPVDPTSTREAVALECASRIEDGAERVSVLCLPGLNRLRPQTGFATMSIVMRSKSDGKMLGETIEDPISSRFIDFPEFASFQATDSIVNTMRAMAKQLRASASR